MADETDNGNLASNSQPGALFGQPDPQTDRQGGINQGSNETPPLTAEEAAERQRRRALGDMVDDNAASHQGGMGAQSGAADFGSQGNLAGGVSERGAGS